jgi:hypothetical protein
MRLLLDVASYSKPCVAPPTYKHAQRLLLPGCLEHRQSERSKTICRRGDQTIPVDRFAAEERCVTTTILRSDARLVTDSPIWNVVMC